MAKKKTSRRRKKIVHLGQALALVAGVATVFQNNDWKSFWYRVGIGDYGTAISGSISGVTPKTALQGATVAIIGKEVAKQGAKFFPMTVNFSGNKFGI